MGIFNFFAVALLDAPAAALNQTVVATLRGSSVSEVSAADPRRLESVPFFEPVVDAPNQACRGRNANDNSDAYFTLHSNVANFEGCMDLCKAEPLCTGIEFAEFRQRCEVWTRQIGATFTVGGYGCWRYQDVPRFIPADGGTDRACRGSSTTDRGSETSGSYWLYYTKAEYLQADPLNACKLACAQSSLGCTGIEFNRQSGRCEIWKASIGYTQGVTGYTCLRFNPLQTTTTQPSTGFQEQEGALIQIGGEVRVLAVGSSNTPWQTWPEQMNLMLKRMGYQTPAIPATSPDVFMHPSDAPICDDADELSVIESPRIGKIGWSSWGYAFENKDDCDATGFRKILSHNVSCTNAWACNPNWCCGRGPSPFIKPSAIAEDARHSQVVVLSNWINDSKQRHAKNVCFGGEAVSQTGSTAITLFNLKRIIDAIHYRNSQVVVVVLALYPDSYGETVITRTLPQVAEINEAVRKGLAGIPNTIFADYTFPSGQAVFQTMHRGHANCRGDKVLATAVMEALYREKILARGLALAAPETCLSRSDCESMDTDCCHRSALCKVNQAGQCVAYSVGMQHP
eukprot:TRINITY_DN39856_c0_g1_i1.p1 TRINITY_DN39856_c0_g1~~TRINITY_DN39856_c0_g1_i1.p1  ORF type:complete len:570 (+),score=78.75 TRINITY_DN39856_c0_g1_i1:74-1783(+)